MAQAVATKSFAERIMWDQRVKPALLMLAVGALGYLIGAYWMAPRTAAQQPNHVPVAYAGLASGSVTLVQPDGTTALLPVKVLDTGTAREVGFRNVGTQTLDNSFLFYALTRETTSRASYTVDGIRSPISYAAIDGTGAVVSVTEATPGTTRVSIAERHQWLLAATPATLERFGVTVGSTIDTESIRKF